MNVVDLSGTTADVVPAGATAETVTEVQHYTDDLFRFRMTRPELGGQNVSVPAASRRIPVVVAKLIL